VRCGPEESVQVLAIPLLDDGLLEGPEAFAVTLSDPAGAGILGPVTLSVVIILDDEQPAAAGNPPAPPAAPPGTVQRVPLFAVGSAAGRRPLVRVFNAD